MWNLFSVLFVFPSPNGFTTIPQTRRLNKTVLLLPKIHHMSNGHRNGKKAGDKAPPRLLSAPILPRPARSQQHHVLLRSSLAPPSFLYLQPSSALCSLFSPHSLTMYGCSFSARDCNYRLLGVCVVVYVCVPACGCSYVHFSDFMSLHTTVYALTS